MSVTAYPLFWPAGWPRTPASERLSDDRFKRPTHEGHAKRRWTFDETVIALDEELSQLGATNLVLSSNFQRDLSGRLRQGRTRPDDEGIAVYFSLRGAAKVMACNRFQRAEGNLRSLALAVRAMRQLELHGGGAMMDRAFAGFASLPGPSMVPWPAILGVPRTATRDEIEVAFRRQARTCHPDAGGSDTLMANLNAARAAALAERT